MLRLHLSLQRPDLLLMNKKGNTNFICFLKTNETLANKLGFW